MSDYITVKYNGIADYSVETPQNWSDWHVCTPLSPLMLSQNPIRNAVFNELERRNRKYSRTDQPLPEYYPFLVNKAHIYLPVLSKADYNNQAWEGVTLQEIIENHKQLLPKIFKHYNAYGYNAVLEMLDKFTRMKTPVQMALYALRQLTTIKR